MRRVTLHAKIVLSGGKPEDIHTIAEIGPVITGVKGTNSRLSALWDVHDVLTRMLEKTGVEQIVEITIREEDHA